MIGSVQSRTQRQTSGHVQPCCRQSLGLRASKRRHASAKLSDGDAQRLWRQIVVLPHGRNHFEDEALAAMSFRRSRVRHPVRGAVVRNAPGGRRRTAHTVAVGPGTNVDPALNLGLYYSNRGKNLHRAPLEGMPDTCGALANDTPWMNRRMSLTCPVNRRFSAPKRFFVRFRTFRARHVGKSD